MVETQDKLDKAAELLKIIKSGKRICKKEEKEEEEEEEEELVNNFLKKEIKCE